MKTYCTECGTLVKYKEREKCKKCNKIFCGLHIYVAIIDDTNRSITNNSGMVCLCCHKTFYQLIK